MGVAGCPFLSVALVEGCVFARGCQLKVVFSPQSSTGFQDSTGNNPSSSTSRQDSLHKAPNQKGIKSSISHLFHKKEKGGPEHPGKEALGPGGCFTVQREEGLQACPFWVSPTVPTRLLSLTLGILLGAGVEEASVFSMGLR